MTALRLPLVGVSNQRTIDGTNSIIVGQDQRFVNCVFGTVTNPVTGKSIFYLEKRPGLLISSLVSAGNISTGLIRSDTIGSVISAFGATNSTIFDTQTSVGAITGEALHFSESLLSAIGYIMIRSSDGTGWYYASNAKTQTSYTGDTHTNTTIDNIASTVGMYSGQAVSGTNIVAGTRIASVTNGTTIVLDTATTGTTAGVTITKTPIARILDSDFVTTGTNLSAFVDMDGYQFYCSEDGYLYNSDLNTVHLYTASNKIAVNMAPDLPVAVAIHRNHVVVFGTASTEFFYNAGNAAGSPLNRAEQYFQRVGIQNQRSLAALEDTLYFISSSRTGDVQVKQLSNFAITTISTPVVDRIIGTGNATGSAMYLNAFTLGGYSYLLVQVLSIISVTTIVSLLDLENLDSILLENGDDIIIDSSTSTTSGLTRELVYNINLKIWSEWDSSLMTFVKGLGTGSTNQLVCASRLDTSGAIYGINPSSDTEVYADNGASYTQTVQTSAPDFGTDKKKFIRSITRIGDISAGSSLLEKSDDDYTTWQTLGTFDHTKKEQKITRCGSHKGERAYRITDSGNTPSRAQAIEVVYDIGEA